MDTYHQLESLANELKTDYLLIKRKLRNSAEFKLMQERQKGICRLVKVTFANGQRHRNNMKEDSQETKALVSKMVLQRREDALGHNLDLIKGILPLLKDDSFDSSVSWVSSKLPMLERAYISNSVVDQYIDQSQSVLSKQFQPADYLTEKRIHSTSRGLMVRSKSEVIIAEALYKHNIPFVYEPQVSFAGKNLVPDFVVSRWDGKIMYWEHFGLTNNDDYLQRMDSKLHWYRQNGIVPWDNLIQTFDTKEGTIDIKQIDNIVRVFLLR